MPFIQFQSTFPRGERQRVRIHIHALDYFNPRSRVGNDDGTRWAYHILSNFNPRSRVGNDRMRRTSPVSHKYFNPRSRVGNDEYKKTQMRIDRNFNPRSRVGNDCKFRQIFFVLFMQQAQSSTFIIPSLFSFCVIHFIFLIFLVRIPTSFYVCFWFAPT